MNLLKFDEEMPNTDYGNVIELYNTRAHLTFIAIFISKGKRIDRKVTFLAKYIDMDYAGLTGLPSGSAHNFENFCKIYMWAEVPQKIKSIYQLLDT